MHKKLEAELVSLAHSILQMKNKDDVNALHKKTREIYEKLSVLKFVDENIITSTVITETKEEINEDLEIIAANAKNVDVVPEVNIKKDVSDVSEPVIEIEKASEMDKHTEVQEEEVFGIENEMIEDDKTELKPLQVSLEEEFKDAISADVATELFEKATKENPVIEEKEVSKPRSLNDALFKNNLQIGLNDRIAFVKHLFDGSQEDFNRVLSQLNSFKSEKEAQNFINEFVKPDYDWSTKEDYELRLMNIIERKFS